MLEGRNLNTNTLAADCYYVDTCPGSLQCQHPSRFLDRLSGAVATICRKGNRQWSLSLQSLFPTVHAQSALRFLIGPVVGEGQGGPNFQGTALRRCLPEVGKGTC